MILQFKLLLIVSIITAQQIILGGECECHQIMIEQDCKELGNCIWDFQLMHCIKQNQQINQWEQNEKRDQRSISLYCEIFTIEECSSKSSCVWYNNNCSFFTGCSVYFKKTHEECQQISINCISNGFNCIPISDCNKYKNQYSCFQNTINNYCYWDLNTENCYQITSCDQLPITLLNHNDCQNQLQKCTAKQNGGCIDLQYFCENYDNEISCQINLLRTTSCFWYNNNCLEKKCDNAPITLINDEECSLFMENCTAKFGGGCSIRKRCLDAQVQAACIVDQVGQSCFWDGTLCQNRFCENAPEYFVSNVQCKEIDSQCITTGAGCRVNYGCQSAFLERACETGPNGEKCKWIENKCQELTCNMISVQNITDEQCEKIMPTCKANQDNNGCIVKLNIEDNLDLKEFKQHFNIKKECQFAPLNYTTNEECISYLPNCITKLGGGCKIKQYCSDIDVEIACVSDQQNHKCYWNQQAQECIEITTCWNIKFEKACVEDSYSNQCQWLISQINNGICIPKSCQSAPLNIKTEFECQQYFQPNDGSQCTTKKMGGCKIKEKCENSEWKESCTTDNEGKQCLWDSLKSLCRIQQCSDLVGQSFLSCNQYNNKCTIGLNGYCADLQICEQIQNKHFCIYGLDGPCLWISNFQNQNGSRGKCMQFNSCQSIKWNTDAECKLISHYCTTDGYQCISIDLCENTNFYYGCVTGTNGECIKTTNQLNNIQRVQCELFNFCEQAHYQTHLECQIANKHCTTDGIQGSIQTKQCNYYNNKLSCVIDDIGILKDSKGNTISTGNCVWNDVHQQCRQQQCQDIRFTTTVQCEQVLNYCTSNGLTCVEKKNCQEHTNKQDCIQQVGKQGLCYWKLDVQTNSSNCQQMTCEDIQLGYNNSNCSIIQNCITDGQICIEKMECEYYYNKVLCVQGGSNGLCIWNDQIQQCTLMKNCEAANSDKIICLQAQNRCQWIDSSFNQPSQCIEYTCESYYKKYGECQYFSTWDQSQCNICRMIQHRCTFFDVQNLQEEECYSFSLNNYYWNPISNKCSQCQKSIPKNDNFQESINEIPIKSGQNLLKLFILVIMNI